MDLFGSTIDVLSKAMDLRMINNRVIASNLANVDTPGYQAQRMDFEASIQRAIAQIEAAGGVNFGAPEWDTVMKNAFGGDTTVEPIIEPTGDAAGLDGNNVNMEGELGELGHNSLMYQLTARLVAAKFNQLKDALNSEP